MCGIAGFIHKYELLGEPVLQHFVATQKHRGPDASGTFLENGFGLAHNRLSILDTSCRADQPFTSLDGRYVIAYNGEVYNFKELQNKLHIPLRSTSDTEVILELFAKEGAKCVESFRGMFALAIYDRQEQCLWLMRDRLGIKPLYYYQDDESFLFSSELKGLAELPELKGKLSINEEAVQHYLHLGFVPSEFSIFKQIKKFPQAHTGKIGKEMKLELVRYWDINQFIEPQRIDFETAKNRIKELLFQSVKEHLISDVPVGLFLSGGIDSSLLAAIAKQVTPEKIKTFTIGFKGNHDEAPYAKQISEYLGTEHHTTYLTLDDSLALLQKVNETYDEPFADTSAIPTMLVSRFASEHVKVVLSGEGADELFLGYNTHNWANRLDKVYAKASRPFVRLLSQFSRSPQIHKANAHLSLLGTPYHAANIYGTEHGFFSAEEITQMSQNYNGFSYKPSRNGLQDQILFEIEVALKDGLLVKMDRATMRYGIEARVPYLDHRLMEFVLSLELKHKFKPNKHILKEILFELIPKSLFDRKKWGFALDSENELKYYLQSTASSPESLQNNLQRLFCQYNLDNNKYYRAGL